MALAGHRNFEGALIDWLESFFSSSVQTADQKKYFVELQQLLTSEEVGGTSNSQFKPDAAAVNASTAYHNHRRAFVRQLAAVTKDLEERGGTAGLFQLLRSTAVRAQLPPVFQFIINLSCDGLPEWIYEKNADAHKLKLTTKLYHTFPRRTVLGILKVLGS